jgi:selenocysteine-specific elongation factor
LTGIDTAHLAEERRRGMTIDLGFAPLRIPGAALISFIDVPGHERFIKTMLCRGQWNRYGAARRCCRDGPMPQTREHLQIMDLLRIRSCCVALTKVDQVSSARVLEVRQLILDLVAATRFASPAIFEVDAVRGQGVEALRNHLIECSRTPARSVQDAYFRMPIDRGFVKDGAGLIVTGTCASGTVSPGDQLVLLPSRSSARVRSVQTHSETVDRAGAGARCALNVVLQGAGHVSAARGDWIVAPEIALQSACVDVRVEVLGDQPLRNGLAVYFYLGAERAPARLFWLNAKNIAKIGFAHLVFTAPIHVLTHDRFILRNSADDLTLGGGVVLDPFAPAKKYRQPERLVSLAAHEEVDAHLAFARLLEHSDEGVALDEFFQARNLRPAKAAALKAALDIVTVGQRAFDRRHWQRVQSDILNTVSAAERESGGREGSARSSLIKRQSSAQGEIFASALETLVRDKRLVQEGSQYRTPRQNLSAGDEKFWREVEVWLRPRPPATVETTSDQVNRSVKDVEHLLRRAMSVDLVRRIQSGRYFTKEEFFDLLALAQALAEQSSDGIFTTAQFRDKSGLGRNLSIELLEHFDRIRRTRRVGEGRMFLKLAAPEMTSGTSEGDNRAQN